MDWFLFGFTVVVICFQLGSSILVLIIFIGVHDSAFCLIRLNDDPVRCLIECICRLIGLKPLDLSSFSALTLLVGSFDL